jgi:hypothetical protein
MRRRVDGANISEIYIASIFRVEFKFLKLIWREHVRPKPLVPFTWRHISEGRRDHTAVRTSDLTTCEHYRIEKMKHDYFIYI